MSCVDDELDLLEEDQEKAEDDLVDLPGGLAPSVDEPDTSQISNILSSLPILPIRDTVVFPGTIVPLTVGRSKSRKLIKSILKGDKIFGALAQRNAETEDPGLDDLYRVGTTVSILKVLDLSEGNQSIIVHGLTRFGVEKLTQTTPFLIAKANTREDVHEPSTELEALTQTVKNQASRVIELTPGVPDDAMIILNNIDKASSLADFLAANLTLGLIEKQELLETFDVSLRLRKITKSLAAQLEILELSQKIHAQVRGQIDKAQREHYLHEQLQAIQKELGLTEGREAEIEEIRTTLAKAKMPEAVEKEAQRELSRLGRIPQASPEYSGAIDYLQWLGSLPWSISTEDNLNIPRAEKVLEADHYGLAKVKRRILETLAVRKLRPEGRGPILCFAGPPGVGKTSLGRSIARALGRKFIRMSVGGVRDEADIRGHRRTYIGSMPGRVIQEIRKAGANNPVFMIDEVDKIGSDFRGDPSSALLEVLDPEQNDSFQDHYLSVPFDLSKTMFICTANYMANVPPPLQDRMEVIELPGYTRLDKLHIAKKYLVPRRREEAGLKPRQLRFTDQALRKVIESYTAEAGVRNLEREIGSICRGIAAKVARRRKHPATIKIADVKTYLGPVKHEPELALRTSMPGVVTGLAWTPVGGEILFVEATSMPGKGGFQLTGQLGDVMKESVHAAYSVIRSRAERYGVDPKALARSDIHIHVPAGSVPKDGPSAGITMFAALVSLFTNQACRSDLAMTGEITLRGLVLPIGGLKEKALAAARAGIKTIIISHRNEKDLVDIPAEVRRQIEFVPVKRVDEILPVAFAEKGRKNNGNKNGKKKAPKRKTATKASSRPAARSSTKKRARKPSAK